MNYYIYQNPEDKRKLKLKQQIASKLESIVTDPTQADLILVLGGDGTMIDAIHDLYQYNKPFFGVNCGTLGFMLNDIRRVKQIPASFEQIELITEPFLEADITSTTGHTWNNQLAVNDILVSEDVRNFPKFTISRGNKRLTQIKASGLVISSALGSTGYWANGMGTMIPTGNNNIWFMSVLWRPFSYKIANGIVPYEVDINYRFPVDAHIDGVQDSYRDVEHIVVKNSDKTFTLGFAKSDEHTSVFHNKRLKLFTEKLQRTL